MGEHFGDRASVSSYFALFVERFDFARYDIPFPHTVVFLGLQGLDIRFLDCQYVS